MELLGSNVGACAQGTDVQRPEKIESAEMKCNHVGYDSTIVSGMLVIGICILHIIIPN